MKTKVRNHLSTLCLRYVQHKDPKTFKLLSDLADDNYKTGFRQYSVAYVYARYLAKLHQDQQIEELEG